MIVIETSNHMIINILLEFAFLFFVGSLFGWVLEVFYRRFVSAANPERKWINPGFLAGPYLPLYGFSLCALFSLAHIRINFIENKVIAKLVLFCVMSMVVTLIEFIAGMIFIHKMKIKLWDYDNEWGNIKGVICPKYTFFWALLSALYYFVIHPRILNSVYWLTNHIGFSFFIGFFYGMFVLDFWYSMNVLARIKKFANDNGIIVRYEILKSTIRSKSDEMKERSHFFFSFVSEKVSFTDNLKYYLEREQERFGRLRENYDIAKDAVKGEYNAIKESIKGGYEQAKESIKGGYEQAKESIRNGYDNVRREKEENPDDETENVSRGK